MVLGKTVSRPWRCMMSPREAIAILMLSPVYFRLSLVERWRLVREYCILARQSTDRRTDNR